MSEQQRLLDALSRNAVLAGIRWATVSAGARAAADFDAATGYDELWLGVARFVLLRDRLDRVFSLGRYAAPEGADPDVGLDVLHDGLSDQDIKTMPRIAPGVVTRSDVNGSPGWEHDGVRWLLTSMPIGGIDEINWARKSLVKQRVAAQPDPDANLETLFHQLPEDEVPVELLEAPNQQPMDLPTLMVAHAQDVTTDKMELFIGLPATGTDGGRPWAWREDLLAVDPPEGGRRVLPAVDGPPSRDVPDAPVTLRQTPKSRPGAAGSGTGNAASTVDGR